MRLSRRALRIAGGNKTASHEANINLVPMIDILTVLVLYLLVGSIASHLAILKLNLPAPSQPVPEKPPMALTVQVRATELNVGDANGILTTIPNTPDGYNLGALGDFLAKVKQKNPTETSVTILMEPDLTYDTLVQVMDTARVFPTLPEDAKPGVREMFPNISIGDAHTTSPAPATAPQTVVPPGSGQ
jgi:biopolymer transport protein ExbD